MESYDFETIKYLTTNGSVNSTSKFQRVEDGILIEVGAASEVLIPWHCVLEFMGPRGSWQDHHTLTNTRSSES